MAAPVKTQASAAKKLGISVRQFRAWISEGAPVRPDGRYSLQAIRRWRDGLNGGQNLSDREKLLKAQAREREAKAELCELQLDIEKGAYISRDEIKERDRRRIAVVKRGLLGLPRSVAPLLAGLSPPEAEQLLMTKVRDLLRHFSEM